MRKYLRRTRSITERFYEKIMPEPNSGCWLWDGWCNYKGYGYINLGRRGDGIRGAHIVSYEIHTGNVPAGLEIDHRCGVKSCVNPAHLEAVSHHENVLRYWRVQ